MCFRVPELDPVPVSKDAPNKRGDNVSDPTYLALLGTAAFIGLFHTLTGPDHYVPFVMMSRARGWSLEKTLAVTACCGVGHVASSILLGFIGIILGTALSRLIAVENLRGELAGWLLLALGVAYMLWSLHRAWRPQRRRHLTSAANAFSTAHGVVTPWALFLIFVFGPCEPLIPLLMYPAASSGVTGALSVAAVFALATIVTMLLVVTLAYVSIPRATGRLVRYSHATCGAAIAACGAAVCFGL